MDGNLDNYRKIQLQRRLRDRLVNRLSSKMLTTADKESLKEELHKTNQELNWLGEFCNEQEAM